MRVVAGTGSVDIMLPVLTMPLTPRVLGAMSDDEWRAYLRDRDRIDLPDQDQLDQDHRQRTKRPRP